jgi:hypothetical protein
VEEMVNYYRKVVLQNPTVLIFHPLAMTTDGGAVLQVTYRKLRTLDDKKKNGQFEKLSNP